MSSKTTSSQRRQRLAEVRHKQRRQRRIRKITLWVAAAAVVVMAGLYGVWQASSPEPQAQGGSAGGSGRYPYQVGEPGIGKPAPPFSLAATTGKQISLADYQGKNVLIYFQEGLMCEPCWDQIGDLEKNRAALEAAGVEEMISITVDPVDMITRKMRDDGYSTPVLSDPDLTVTKAYDANSYGMMGGSRPGHSFLLVGPDGKIRWRADYGGAPKYTMFLPTTQVIADMRRDMKAAGQ